jgi:hypothetical protein
MEEILAMLEKIKWLIVMGNVFTQVQIAVAFTVLLSRTRRD